MPGITLAQAQAALDNALAAHAAILAGGTRYRYNDRWIDTPPLTEVEASIERWNRLVQTLEAGGKAGGIRISGITPG
jgi:hypothetical protein